MYVKEKLLFQTIQTVEHGVQDKLVQKNSSKRSKMAFFNTFLNPLFLLIYISHSSSYTMLSEKN